MDKKWQSFWDQKTHKTLDKFGFKTDPPIPNKEIKKKKKSKQPIVEHKLETYSFSCPNIIKPVKKQQDGWIFEGYA